MASYEKLETIVSLPRGRGSSLLCGQEVSHLKILYFSNEVIDPTFINILEEEVNKNINNNKNITD